MMSKGNKEEEHVSKCIIFETAPLFSFLGWRL